MTKKNMDILAGIGFFAFAGLLFIAAGFMPTREGGIPALNTGFYPRLLSIILAVLSVLMIIEAIRKQYVQKDVEAWWTTKAAFSLFAVTLILLVLYPFIMKFLGFATASLIFITTLTWMLSDKAHRRPLVIGGISLALTVIVYIIFKMVLAIPFPQGMLI